MAPVIFVVTGPTAAAGPGTAVSGNDVARLNMPTSLVIGVVAAAAAVQAFL